MKRQNINQAMFSMDNRPMKVYNMNEVSHKVNVFHIYSGYHYMKIKCADCKLEEFCRPVKHKREICAVANDTEESIGQYVYGKNSSFAYDDFYIIENDERERLQIAKKLYKIQQKYLANEYVRQ